MHIKQLRTSRWLSVSSLVIWFLFFNVFLISAQSDIPTPIAIGESIVGEIIDTGQVLTYALPVGSPQVLEVDVFAITPDLLPSFRVLTQSRDVVEEVINTGSESTVQAKSISVSDGFFLIEVFSQDNSLGQFLITIQPGPPLEPPQMIGLGQVVTGNVNNSEPRHAYQFVSPESATLSLTVFNDDPTQPLEITLKDANTDETLASSTTRISRVTYRIIPGLADYLIEVVTNDVDGSQTYTLCLDDEANPVCPIIDQTDGQPGEQPVATATPPAPPAVSPTQTPMSLATLPSTGDCIVASASGGAVNIRSGPSTSFTVIGQISGNTTAPVIGRLPDNSWYQINPNGLIGWISASVVRLGGVCNVVPALTLTPTAPSTIPSETPTSAGPSATPVSTQMGGGATPTFSIILTPIAPFTLAPITSPTLNYSLPPVSGSVSLTSGFVPDPTTKGITGGGPVNVSYLGGSCSGFTTSAPSYSVNYTSGAFPSLRFYFVGNADSTMVINTPGGNYFCVDDSFGTLNPTLDFNSPSSGRYDVWIGSYASGTSVSGTLYITESTGNHP